MGQRARRNRGSKLRLPSSYSPYRDTECSWRARHFTRGLCNEATPQLRRAETASTARMPAPPSPPRLALLAAWVVLFASSPARGADYAVRLTGRGLHSLPSKLNLWTFGTHRSRLSST